MKEKLLVLGNYTDAMYHPLAGVDERLRGILSEQELVCTDRTQMLLSLEKEQFAGVISYLDIWNSALPEQETEALYRFAEEGGAILLLHNGISIQNREILKEMAGARFLTHPPKEEICFKTKPHAITEGCGGFALTEEPYQFEMTDDGKEVFLVYVYRGTEYAAGWSKTVGKGRLVFLTPGHTPEIFDCPEYAALIRKSMQWCLKK